MQKTTIRQRGRAATSHSHSTAAKHRIQRQVRARQPAHVRMALHPTSLFALLLVGVCVIGSALLAAADSYSVTAKVPAAALTDAATITHPNDGFSTTDSMVTVNGTCPDNAYVTLAENTLFAGSAGCVSNTYSIAASLAAGGTVLQVQAYNLTDDAGPATPPITVTRTIPASTQLGTPPAAPSGSQPSAPADKTQSPPGTPALQATLPGGYHFQAFAASQTATWQVALSGGAAPYQLNAAWGDRTASTMANLAPGTLTLSHRYHDAGYYPVVITLTDARNTATVLQLAAFVQPAGATNFTFGSSAASSSSSSGSPLQSLFTAVKGWLWIATPAYIICALMVVSFWLGERREVQTLLTIVKHTPHTRSHR